MKNIYAVLMLSFIFITTTLSQDFWKPLNGPDGFVAMQNGIDLNDNYFVSIRGEKKIFRSSDHGITWEYFGDGIPDRMNDLVNKFVNAKDGSVFSKTSYNLYVLRPHTKKWERVLFDVAEVCLAISVNPDGDIYIASRNNVYKSKDNGVTFDKIFELESSQVKLSTNGNNKNFIISTRGASVVLYSFDDNGDDINILDDSLAINTGLFYDKEWGKLFLNSVYGTIVSVDDGHTWNDVVKANSDSFYYMSQSPDGTLYSSTYNDVYTSKDHGVTWESVMDINSLYNYGVQNILFTNENSLFVFASFWSKREGSQLIFSDKYFSAVSRIDIEVKQPDIEKISKDKNGTMYANLLSKRYLYSKDDWQTWEKIDLNSVNQKINSLIHDNNGVLYAISKDLEVYKSFDLGKTWTDITPESIKGKEFFTISVSPSGMIYLSSSGKVLYTSKDKGESWLRNEAYSSSVINREFYFHPNGNIYSVTDFSLEVSKDGGKSWEDVFADINIVSLECFHITKNGELLFSGAEVDENDNYDIFLYKIVDNGSYYDFIKFKYPEDFDVYSIESNIDDDIFISNYKNVMKSNDGGETWQKISFNLNTYNYIKLYIDKDQYLYAYPKYDVIYKSVEPTTISSTHTQDLLEQATVKVYPQPFGDNTNIIIEDVVDLNNSVFEVYNSLGKKVHLQKVNTSKFVFHRNNLPQGVYYFRVKNTNKVLANGKLLIQ